VLEGALSDDPGDDIARSARYIREFPGH
jgi:hypothetical protein